MKIKAFITHKKAEKYSDCQDSFAVNSENKTIAVSDGISQTIFSGVWSEILTNAFVENPWGIDAAIPFPKQCLSDCWYKRVEERKQALRDKGNEMNLYMLERMLSDGKTAGATFLGIQFNGQKWDGIVLGDTCLIEIKDGCVKEIHSSQKSETFDNMPDFYDSNANTKGRGVEKRISGELDPNTTLLLVSDPFSDFFFEHKDEAPKFVKELLNVSSHEEYESLAERWRDEYHMHNDDSTVVIVEYDGTDDFDMVYKDDIKELRENERKKIEIPVAPSSKEYEPKVEEINKVNADNNTNIVPEHGEKVSANVLITEIISKIRGFLRPANSTTRSPEKINKCWDRIMDRMTKVFDRYVIYKKQDDGITKHS